MTDHERPRHLRAASGMEAVLLRLQAGARLTPTSASRLEALGGRVESAAARSVLQQESEPVRRPRFLQAGWAFRYRHLSDGRRQIFDLILPGEGVGVCLRPHPFAQTSIASVTSVRLVDAGPLLEAGALDGLPDIHRALEVQADLGERRMLDQIMRLGRLSAIERLAHLLLDLHERLDLVGMVDRDRFDLPPTQEVLADMAGLSVVHVNRTLQELRRQGLAEVGRGAVRLPDITALKRIALVSTAAS